MKYILPINEWIQVNEAYFAKGSSFEKYRETGLSIMNKLIDRYGYSPELAAALVGNMFKESKFNPNAGSTYKGLVQWGSVGGRKEKLLSRPNWNTIDAQLEYVNYELTGAYAKVKKSAESAGSVETAAEIIARKYEGCADPTHPERINGAREIYDLYLDQQIPSKLKFKEPQVSPED